MDKITLKVGTYGVDIKVYVKNSDGTVTDLTDVTPVMKVWRSNTVIVSRNCSVTNVSTGEVTCPIEQGDYTSAGAYYGEIELQGSGWVDNTESFLILVKDSP